MATESGWEVMDDHDEQPRPEIGSAWDEDGERIAIADHTGYGGLWGGRPAESSRETEALKRVLLALANGHRDTAFTRIVAALFILGAHVSVKEAAEEAKVDPSTMRRSIEELLGAITAK